MAADTQATQLCAQALAQALPAGVALVTSPLQRCEQLAQALLGLRPDLTCKKEPRLQEMDFGDWEGRRWDAIGQSALEAWVAAVWDELWAGTPVPLTDTVWIIHAGVMRASALLQRGLRQISQAEQWPTATPGFGEWRVPA